MLNENLINVLSSRYYEGKPLVSDDLYDAIENALGKNFVGTMEGDVSHLIPLYSLQKVYPGDSLPFNEPDVIETIKLDGAAIAIYYLNGKLELALTRGNGKKGKDITHNIKRIVNYLIPDNGLVQVVGEIVAPASIERARNYAAGALALKDPDEFASRDLTFVVHSINCEINFETYSESLEYANYLGFKTVLDKDLGHFPTDGRVVRINNIEKFLSYGFTAKHPRGAYALKENKEGVETTLLDIVWQLGRSGVVAPVAILEPVDIDGAMVSRATLHNWDYIKELELEPNCKVSVIRAGEIIPRIIGKIYD